MGTVKKRRLEIIIQKKVTLNIPALWIRRRHKPGKFIHYKHHTHDKYPLNMVTTAKEWQLAKLAGLELSGQSGNRPVFKGTPEQIATFGWMREREMIRDITRKLKVN